LSVTPNEEQELMVFRNRVLSDSEEQETGDNCVIKSFIYHTLHRTMLW